MEEKKHDVFQGKRKYGISYVHSHRLLVVSGRDDKFKIVLLLQASKLNVPSMPWAASPSLCPLAVITHVCARKTKGDANAYVETVGLCLSRHVTTEYARVRVRSKSSVFCCRSWLISVPQL